MVCPDRRLSNVWSVDVLRPRISDLTHQKPIKSLILCNLALFIDAQKQSKTTPENAYWTHIGPSNGPTLVYTYRRDTNGNQRSLSASANDRSFTGSDGDCGINGKCLFASRVLRITKTVITHNLDVNTATQNINAPLATSIRLKAAHGISMSDSACTHQSN